MAPTEEKDGEEESPEPKIISDLKALDDKYLELEKECQKELQELARKYTEMQQPLLDERAKRLAKSEGDDDAGTFGTPAIKGFWATALSNHPDLEDLIQEWDRAVLEYLRDVTKENLDITDSNKGFRLTFLFSENPYFEHTELWKEYHTEETSPYTGDIDVSEVKSSPITWKPGKDVTVETVKKKAKGGAKKKPPSEKQEVRPSFFRTFFRNMHKDDDPPADVEMFCPEEGMDDDQDDVELMAIVLQADHGAGCAIRDYVIPYAVRWYTGEAAEQLDDDLEDEESEEEEDESESESDDSPRGKGKGKRGGAAAAKRAAPKKNESRDDEAAKKEECKQQ